MNETINQLAAVLQEREVLENTFKQMLESVKSKQHALEKQIEESGKTVKEVPDIIKRLSPFAAWKACEPSIGSCIDAAMTVKHERIVELENSVKGEVDALKTQYELLEGWALQNLEQSGVSSIKGSNGRVESRVQTRYSVPDKKLFVEDALANGYVDELTVSVRPNSKLLASIVEERGELPAGVSMVRSRQAVFVRA